MGADVDSAHCIANAAGERGCNLIVIGSHARNAVQRLIFGSVVTQLIPLATVSVLVCKPPPRRERRAQPAGAGDPPPATPAED